MERGATLSEWVGRQIQDLIRSQRLKPNDRLPGERDLAERFGVSRAVVREAVRSLVAKGLLEVTPGRGGTVVRLPSADTMCEIMTLFLRNSTGRPDYDNLLEVQRVLEVAIAGLAAQRRTPEDLRVIMCILEETRQTGDDCDRYARCDLAFHQALAQATHNPLLLLLLESVGELTIEARYLAFHIISDARERSYRYHKAIFDRVQAGDVEGARTAMHDHLIEAEDMLRKALALREQKVNASKVSDAREPIEECIKTM